MHLEHVLIIFDFGVFIADLKDESFLPILLSVRASPFHPIIKAEIMTGI